MFSGSAEKGRLQSSRKDWKNYELHIKMHQILSQKLNRVTIIKENLQKCLTKHKNSKNKLNFESIFGK